ncbi:unnamed protein product [Brassica oleracea var. botrytis]
MCLWLNTKLQFGNHLGRFHCSPKDRRVSPINKNIGYNDIFNCVVEQIDFFFKFLKSLPRKKYIHNVASLEQVLDLKTTIVPSKFETHDDQENMWYLDNGASNHMTGVRRYFNIINESITGKVKFGDDSRIDIKGKGSIEFVDMNGEHRVITRPGNKYIFVLVDDHTRYMWTILLKEKSDVFEKFKRFKTMVEQDTNQKVQTFRTDRGGEFTSQEFNEFCEQAGIKRHLTAPYTPQQNGVVERRNRTLMEMTRSIVKHFRLPNYLWGEAVRHSTYVLNRVATRVLKDVTPYEAYRGSKPNLSHLRTFGCIGYAKVVNPHLKKLEDRSRVLIHLGTEPGSKAYRMYDPQTRKISVSRDVIFDESKGWNWEELEQIFALRMIMLGIPLDEPHLKDQLSILLKTQRNDLKAGKLLVTESYYLLGTVDPTGKLKQNEVCVILEAGQISGDVLVYRNPGLHFGDIHVLKATYVKALEEHVGNSKYGVFFPQIGPRSLGDEIAGGDFDGDMYFISRNPNGTTNYSPLSIAFGTPSELTPEMLEEKLFRMFLEARFNSSNVVGAAADSWLTIMDRYLTLGDERAKEKAGMKRQILKAIDIYYDALDAPKNGAKVYLPLDLKFESFPHYMEYKHKKSFNSTSILGLIYDTVVSQN